MGRRGNGDERSFRFTWVLIGLVALVVLDLVAPPGQIGEMLSALAALAVIVLTVRALARRRWVLHATVGLGALGISARAITIFSDRPALEISGALAVAAFMAFAAGIILSEVLRARRVTHEEIAGAICTYVLIGVSWAGLYGAFYLHDPASLSLPAWAGKEALLHGGGFTYFSFVTLTTLGYGDIVPVAPHVRALAWIEALFGQIYLAVLVARLVSLQIAPQRGQAGDREPE